eukprot:TRINITY_DN60237_c0_g1_i1.p1 TRINITY_DN60237_c0_g1~~TRINITY_DN60237_c0_g1_i1.p1  ORF type:complete len:194 (+),score=20.46 TRINITY_DN60237_c0_g1_i1:22-603(+)
MLSHSFGLVILMFFYGHAYRLRTELSDHLVLAASDPGLYAIATADGYDCCLTADKKWQWKRNVVCSQTCTNKSNARLFYNTTTGHILSEDRSECVGFHPDDMQNVEKRKGSEFKTLSHQDPRTSNCLKFHAYSLISSKYVMVSTDYLMYKYFGIGSDHAKDCPDACQNESVFLLEYETTELVLTPKQDTKAVA